MIKLTQKRLLRIFACMLCLTMTANAPSSFSVDTADTVTPATRTASVTPILRPHQTYTPIATISPIQTAATTVQTFAVGTSPIISPVQIEDPVSTGDTSFLLSESPLSEPFVFVNPIQVVASPTLNPADQPGLVEIAGDPVVGDQTVDVEGGVDQTARSPSSNGTVEIQRLFRDPDPVFNEGDDLINEPEGTRFDLDDGTIIPRNLDSGDGGEDNDPNDGDGLPPTNQDPPFVPLRTSGGDSSSRGGGSSGGGSPFLDFGRDDKNGPNIFESVFNDSDFVGGAVGAGLGFMNRLLNNKFKKKGRTRISKGESAQEESELNREGEALDRKGNKVSKRMLKKGSGNKTGKPAEIESGQKGILRSILGVESVGLSMASVTGQREQPRMELVKDLAPIHSFQANAPLHEKKIQGDGRRAEPMVQETQHPANPRMVKPINVSVRRENARQIRKPFQQPKTYQLYEIVSEPKAGVTVNPTSFVSEGDVDL